MNRMTRDYCSKGIHPKGWKFWRARYDQSQMAWRWLGNFCDNCGADVSAVAIGTAPTHKTVLKEMRYKGKTKFFATKIPKLPR